VRKTTIEQSTSPLEKNAMAALQAQLTYPVAVTRTNTATLNGHPRLPAALVLSNLPRAVQYVQAPSSRDRDDVISQY
jgi:hypothetical protein